MNTTETRKYDDVVEGVFSIKSDSIREAGEYRERMDFLVASVAIQVFGNTDKLEQLLRNGDA